MTIKHLMIAALGLMATAATAQTVLLNEDFESYADTAALEASWNATVSGQITLVTNAGQGALGSNKYINMPTAVTGNINKAFTSLTVTATDHANLIVYMRAASWNSPRAQVSIRDSATGSQILSIGGWNSTTTNGTGSEDRFVIRCVGIPGAPTDGSGNYTTLLLGGNKAANVWHKLEIAISDTELTTEVNDVPANNFALSGAPAAAFAAVRVGAGVTINQTVDVDSISVVQGDINIGTSVSDWQLMH